MKLQLEEDMLMLEDSSSTSSSAMLKKVKTETYYFNAQRPDTGIVEELTSLGDKIDKLSDNIEHLIRIMNPPIQQLFIETLDYDQAKEMVSAYLREHRTASISELSENLQIDLQTLCEVISELDKEGHIKER